MKSLKQATASGCIVRAIPFIVAIRIVPLRTGQQPLFESVMAVAVASAAILFSYQYLRDIRHGFIREGILQGIIRLPIRIAGDLALFLAGPMKRELADYEKDIGITCLMIPVITEGMMHQAIISGIPNPYRVILPDFRMGHSGCSRHSTDGA